MKTANINPSLAKYGLPRRMPSLRLTRNVYLYSMPTFTVKVPESAKAQFTELVKQLGGEVLSATETKPETKKRVLAEIREGLEEVKAIQEGKREPLSMSDLFRNE